MPSDDATLLDMLRAARLVVEFRGRLDRQSFQRDLKTQSAILHQLLILGEAAKRLSEEFRLAHSEIPGRRIAGMRDKLIHEYHAVDVEEVWNTVDRDVPGLIVVLERAAPGAQQ